MKQVMAGQAEQQAEDDDTIVVDGPDTIVAMTAWADEVQADYRRALGQLNPAEVARLKAWLLTRTSDQPPTRATTPVSSTNGRAPREARNQRRRGSKRGERSKSSSSDDPEPEPERRCENPRCGADISHLRSDARYCENGGACKQQAYRERLTIKKLDDLAGTVTTELSCECEPKHGLVDEGVCHPCGRPRGPVTLRWEYDPAPPSRSFVITSAPKRRNPRLGNRKRKPVTDEQGNGITAPKPEAVAA